MGDNSPAPNERRAHGQSDGWASLIEKEFQDVYSEIESDDGKMSTEQMGRAKRMEEKRRFSD